MANRVRMGSSYLTVLPEHVISRYGGCGCWNCHETLPSDSLAISKRRGSKPTKHYCLHCALELHIISKADLEMALYRMNIPSDRVESIMLEAMR